MISFKGRHFPKELILACVRWYVAYPLSYRNIEEMMGERNLSIDHSTLNRWVIKYAPELEKEFRTRKRAVGASWRMDETYIKVRGSWKYLYRAVDKSGANLSGIEAFNYEHGTDIEIRQCKFLNNIVEQDHRFIKKVTRPSLGYKNFYSAAATIAGIELMHMIRKNQSRYCYAKNRSYAEQFYSLAA